MPCYQQSIPSGNRVCRIRHPSDYGIDEFTDGYVFEESCCIGPGCEIPGTCVGIGAYVCNKGKWVGRKPSYSQKRYRDVPDPLKAGAKKRIWVKTGTQIIDGVWRELRDSGCDRLLLAGEAVGERGSTVCSALESAEWAAARLDRTFGSRAVAD